MAHKRQALSLCFEQKWRTASLQCQKEGTPLLHLKRSVLDDSVWIELFYSPNPRVFKNKTVTFVMLYK